MSHDPRIAALVQTIYSNGAHTRASFADDHQRALAYYRDYVEFVGLASEASSAGAARTLLDVGCGNAWSSFAFASAGYHATGIDLNPEAFECPSHPDLHLRSGSMMELPFADSSFDLVATYQCLEHIPDPRKGLTELARVCRPGGAICVVGPNLITPLIGARALYAATRNRTLALRRTPSTPSHPGGNTLGEHLASMVKSSVLLVTKRLRKDCAFRMRIPDVQPPFYGDNDACYLCTPSNLVAFFHPPAFRLLQNGKPGRLGPLHVFASGTWVSVQKALTRKSAPKCFRKRSEMQRCEPGGTSYGLNVGFNVGDLRIWHR